MKRLAYALILVALAMGFAEAAGPFDGAWTGAASGQYARCQGLVTATVTDNAVTGSAMIGSVNIRLSGAIASDGKFTGKWGPFDFTGEFKGGSFLGTYRSTAASCLTVHVSLTRS